MVPAQQTLAIFEEAVSLVVAEWPSLETDQQRRVSGELRSSIDWAADAAAEEGNAWLTAEMIDRLLAPLPALEPTR